MRRSQLQNILAAPQWKTVEAVAEQVKTRYKTGSKKGADEFETLWNLAKSEGAIEGIEAFFQEIFNEASKSDD